MKIKVPMPNLNQKSHLLHRGKTCHDVATALHLGSKYLGLGSGSATYCLCSRLLNPLELFILWIHIFFNALIILQVVVKPKEDFTCVVQVDIINIWNTFIKINTGFICNNWKPIWFLVHSGNAKVSTTTNFSLILSLLLPDQALHSARKGYKITLLSYFAPSLWSRMFFP